MLVEDLEVKKKVSTNVTYLLTQHLPLPTLQTYASNIISLIIWFLYTYMCVCVCVSFTF